MPQDSTGKPIRIGDRVRFRGKEYTIKGFSYGRGRFNIATVEFEEPQHTSEVADEISVDFVGLPKIDP